MNKLLSFLINFCNNITFWYSISIIFGMIILYQIVIKNEWQKLRIDNKICNDDDTSFQYRRIWLLKNILLINIVIFLIVCLINVSIIDENDFNSTVTIIQKIRNFIPIIIVYTSIAFVQKVSIEEKSSKNLDKLILLFLEIKKEMVGRLVKDEIYYIKKQNRKIIHKISEAYIEEQSTKELSEASNSEMISKLLCILLDFSICDEFKNKHKYEIKAFQSDSKKEGYLVRVISIRASLIGEKPFNEKEFDYFCTNVLPEIGISYSDIYQTIKSINKYNKSIVINLATNKDSYFQEKFINNCVANEELSKDSFEKEIDKVEFPDSFCGEEKLCIATNSH